MENKEKGVNDVWNNSRRCRYRGDSHQHYRDSYQHPADSSKRKTSKKQPPRPRISCFFDK